jgi:hypothetical protein
VTRVDIVGAREGHDKEGCGVAGRRKRRDQGAGRVRQLPSGRWQARYPTADGLLRAAPQTFDTKLDASAWLDGREWDDEETITAKRTTFRLEVYAER